MEVNVGVRHHGSSPPWCRVFLRRPGSRHGSNRRVADPRGDLPGASFFAGLFVLPRYQQARSRRVMCADMPLRRLSKSSFSAPSAVAFRCLRALGRIIKIGAIRAYKNL
jgi:hypothetical protein